MTEQGVIQAVLEASALQLVALIAFMGAAVTFGFLRVRSREAQTEQHLMQMIGSMHATNQQMAQNGEATASAILLMQESHETQVTLIRESTAQQLEIMTRVIEERGKTQNQAINAMTRTIAEQVEATGNVSQQVNELGTATGAHHQELLDHMVPFKEAVDGLNVVIQRLEKAGEYMQQSAASSETLRAELRPTREAITTLTGSMNELSSKIVSVLMLNEDKMGGEGNGLSESGGLGVNPGNAVHSGSAGGRAGGDLVGGADHPGMVGAVDRPAGDDDPEADTGTDG